MRLCGTCWQCLQLQDSPAPRSPTPTCSGRRALWQVFTSFSPSCLAHLVHALRISNTCCAMILQMGGAKRHHGTDRASIVWRVEGRSSCL